MERNNGKVIAVVALVVAVIGLSLGFAAFSTTLKIDSAANVSTGSSNWNVGFGTSSSAIVNSQTTKAATGTNTGVLAVTKYTLSQNTNATLNFTDTKSVVYDLYIVNEGTTTAYLDNVTFSSPIVSCANASATASSLIDGASGAGTYTTGGNTTTLTAEQCNSLFSVTLKIDSTDYTSTTTGITGKSIAAKANDVAGNVPVKLTIAYKDDATAQALAATLDGDIVVTVGTISIGYKSTSN